MKMLFKLVVAVTLLHLAPAVVLPLAPALAQAQDQAPKKAPPELQKEFEVFIAKFRAALKANDSAAVASMTKLPLEFDDAVRDAAQFRAKTYKEHFTAKTRTCLQRSKAVYDRPPDNSEYYVIFCDESLYTFAKTPDGFRFTDIGVND